MTKSKTTTSYRFDDDFIDLLDTWAFVSQTEKGVLLQEAFRSYTEQNPGMSEKVQKVQQIMRGEPAE
ncbi:hypothetical protein [Paenibacillus daejeonensis]|uniref:hypothetical protein n=1 Tax=Paenibacillus daejeonensis TaxID=135193 RepID=UPI000374424F|nr:hypothetical protein [Paenibacillus daejeonensis]